MAISDSSLNSLLWLLRLNEAPPNVKSYSTKSIRPQPMAFTPTKSPLYGGGPLTVHLEKDPQLNLSLPFFVIFEGSRRRHAVSSHYNDSAGLFCTQIPGHDHAEEVQVSLVQLCSETYEGLGTYSLLAQGQLNYEVDTTFYLARFLTSSVYNDHALDNLELIKSDHFDLSNELKSTLDARLNLALRNANLSPNWHLLGGDSLSDAVCEKRETLLHFCARIGLIQVANFLLEQPGSEDALRLPNRHGELPYNIAHQNGFHELAEMLSGYNTQGLRHTPHPEVVEIDNGVVRSLDDGNISISSYLDNPNMERSIENEIDFLRETEKMIRMQRGITHQQNYNSDWPEDRRPHFAGESQPSSALEQEMEQSMQRLLKNQQLHGQTLQGLLNCSQNNSIEVRRLDDEGPDAAMTEEAYSVLENSRSGIHDLCENLFQLRERSQKAKQTQAIRKKRLTQFSSSCPSLFQPVLHRSLSAVSEKEDEQNAVVEENRGPGRVNRTMSEYSGFPLSISQSDSSYTDDYFDPRVHIRINGVTMDSSETQGRNNRNSLPVELQARKSWDGTEQVDVSGNSSLTQTFLHGSQDIADGIEAAGLNRKSLSLSHLDDDEGIDDDEEEDEDDDEEAEFHLRLNSTKQQSLEESPKSRGPLFSTLSLTNDPVGEDGSISPSSSPQSKEMHEGKMNAGRGLSPYNAISLQDLASPEAGKDLSVMSTSPKRHMFEDSVNITKSVSTPSIPQATELTGDGVRGRECKHQDEKVYRDFLEDYDMFRRQKEIEEVEEEDMSENKSEITLKDFLNEEHSPNDSDEKSGKSGRKEEKKRKPSMFSRFHSSYRTKKSKGKEVKNKEGHNFVAVSFSNSTPCDACHKPLANKAALRCQTCLLNVHESGCKDQLICERRTSFKVLPRESAGYVGHSQATPQAAWPDQQLPSSTPLAAGHSRPANPVKERKSSAPTHSKSFQVPPPILMSHRYSLPTASLFGSPPDSPLGAAQWSSQNSNRFSLYDKAISEEIECDTASTLEASNIRETISESLESLDSDGLVMPAFEGELDVNLLVEEPEAWSLTVDKRTLKKLNAKDIKRQDTIWELIQTERQYVKRLRITQKIFAKNMINGLGYSPEQVDRLFPRIDELVDLHFGFLKEMLALQNKSEDRYIDEIGFLLVSQFQDASADKMKSAYGVFCSKHTEAMQLYKEFIKVDRKFQNFAKQCNHLSICEKRDISDFILGVTVRLSKYPILIEAILKSTKDKKDRENLSIALQSSKDVVQHVDEKVAAYEKLVDIQSKMESRAVMFRGKKFKRQDLTGDGRELIYAGKLGWKTARGRVYDVLAVVLTDVLVFLQKSEQKYTFFIQDNKSSVIPLYRLLVREKNDEKDSIGIYVISSMPEMPEMYELMCQSRTEREGWIRLLQDAIRSCPPEIEPERPVIQPAAPNEEDRKKEEQVASQIKEIIEQLHDQDSKIKECCDEKNRLIQELLGVSTSDADSRPQSNVQEVTSDIESMDIMQAAMKEASRLTTILHGSESHLSRSVSSVGEHVSDSFVATSMPKRAETFAGFDTSYESQSSETSAIKPQQANPEQGLQVPEEEKRQSGEFSVDEGTTSMSENSFSSKDVFKSTEPQPIRTSPSPPKQSASVLLRQARTTLDNSSSMGSQSELSVSPYPPSSSNGEQMTSIGHLVQYLNALMSVTCKQNTKVECLQAELEEAKRQIAKLSADMQGRRTVYGHDQLEELRNVQENINRERQEWERTKSRDKAAMDKERGQLESEKANLVKEKRDLHNKREDFKREKEALQRQIDMMRAQGYHISSNIVDEKPDALDYGNHGKPDGKKLLQDSKKFVSHQRSASADLSHTTAKDMEIKHNRQASDQLATGGAGHYRHARLSVGNLTQAKNSLPVHLLSARNEQRMGGVNVQHLPYKLAGSNSAAALSHPPPPQHHPSYVKSSQSFLKQPGRAGSTDIKRVQSMSASPRSASGHAGSHHSSPSASDLSGLMKLADPKSKSVGSLGSAASGGSGHKGSSSNSGSATKSKSGSKGGSSEGGIFFF